MSLESGRAPPRHGRSVEAVAECATKIVATAACPDGGGVERARLLAELERRGVPIRVARQGIGRAESEQRIYRTASGFREGSA